VQGFEYKVIPAPRRGEKVRGARTVPERFAVALTHAMNDMARDGWEYLRADTLPCEERVGLTGTATHFQNMLVFRRARTVAQAEPARATHAPAAIVEPDPEPEPDATMVVPMPTRVPEGAAPAIGPAVPPMPSTRPNGRI
jgi:hypothetical protein